VIYYNSIWPNFNTISKVIEETSTNSKTTISKYRIINASVVNLTIPEGIKNINESTFYISNLITSNFDIANLLDRFVPILIFSVIILLSGASIYGILFERKILLGIISALLIIMFVITLISAVTGNIISLFLSNYCVAGVDSQTQSIVNGVILQNCTKQTIEYYISCKYVNDSCNPFPTAKLIIDESIVNLTAKINNDTSNPDSLYWNATLKNLKDLNGTLYVLSNCQKSQNSYKHTTQDLCGPVSSNLIMLSAFWDLSTGLLFIYFMLLMFSWNRIKSRYDENGYELIDTDLENKQTLSKKEIYNMKSRRMSSSNFRMIEPNDCTGKCFGFISVIFFFWALMITAVILIYVFGVSANQTVARTK